MKSGYKVSQDFLYWFDSPFKLNVFFRFVLFETFSPHSPRQTFLKRDRFLRKWHHRTAGAYAGCESCCKGTRCRGYGSKKGTHFKSLRILVKGKQRNQQLWAKPSGFLFEANPCSTYMIAMIGHNNGAHFSARQHCLPCKEETDHQAV